MDSVAALAELELKKQNYKKSSLLYRQALDVGLTPNTNQQDIRKSRQYIDVIIDKFVPGKLISSYRRGFTRCKGNTKAAKDDVESAVELTKIKDSKEEIG
ncbi:MAG: hypothetical protein IAF58_19730 [Leptolyngbya sp.]|nr:hypothetical protein [Candidatus Melainabacteria bacterium]